MQGVPKQHNIQMSNHGAGPEWQEPGMMTEQQSADAITANPEQVENEEQGLLLRPSDLQGGAGSCKQASGSPEAETQAECMVASKGQRTNDSKLLSDRHLDGSQSLQKQTNLGEGLGHDAMPEYVLQKHEDIELGDKVLAAKVIAMNKTEAGIPVEEMLATQNNDDIFAGLKFG